MVKKVIISGFAITLLTMVLAAGCSKAETAKKTDEPAPAVEGASQQMALVPQKTCPVMGNPINKDLYCDVNGKRIYVCCGGCIDPIKKDPEKYLQKLKESGEQPETIQ